MDIDPCTEAPVKSFLYHCVPDFSTLTNDQHALYDEERYLAEKEGYDDVKGLISMPNGRSKSTKSR